MNHLIVIDNHCTISETLDWKSRKKTTKIKDSVIVVLTRTIQPISIFKYWPYNRFPDKNRCKIQKFVLFSIVHGFNLNLDQYSRVFHSKDDM